MLDHLSEENVRLLLVGAGSGSVVAWALRAVRWRWGLPLGILAPLLGFFAAGRLDWTDQIGVRVAAAAVVGLAAGRGFETLRTGRSRPTEVLVFLGSAGGVWLGVPENDPVLIVVGVIGGLLAVGRHREAGVGWGLGVALAWTVVIGSLPTGWSFVGGLLSLSPLVAVALRPLVPTPRFSLAAWPWLVVGAWSVSLAAARWVAVAPDATWTRVVAVGAGAATIGWIARR